METRRAVALAGHTGDASVARQALEDPAPTVRATALGALARLGQLSDDDLSRAIADRSADVRRRACELATAHPAVDLMEVLDDSDPSVVEMAAWASGERGDRRAVSELARLAGRVGGHPDPLCREAAVAALGALGDPRGVEAVLGALDDRPAIRRRAATALAAFDGAAVDEALRRCLSDRDWQVRQIAEDLLADE